MKFNAVLKESFNRKRFGIGYTESLIHFFIVFRRKKDFFVIPMVEIYKLQHLKNFLSSSKHVSLYTL